MTPDIEKIENFKKSIHYRDICYLIDHIDNQDILNSCAEELGYSIGVDIITRLDRLNPTLKTIFLGGNGEFRVISYLHENRPIAESVICRIF